jgi:hypothetical protein
MTASVLAGVLGPLAVVWVSWMVMSRTFRRDPGRLTAVMMAAFAAKMAFFAAYVALTLTLIDVQPAAFAASFAVSFIALYAVEAVYLRRLLAGKSA